jgi:Sucrase/ferredoxin-like
MSCSALSAAAGIPLAGTAKRGERWLLLEHRAPWGRDALEDSGLAPELAQALEETGRNVLLLRRPGRPQGAPVAFAARTAEAGSRLVRLELGRLEDVLDVDPDRDGVPVAGQLVLVCTHARRDACCATHGVPAYNALRRHVPEGMLWRSSHQGGHRFAANVLALPDGIQLGRVEPGAAAEVAAALADGRIPLPFYRGRTLHAREVQAADAAVRTELGLDRVDDVRLRAHDGSRVVLDTPGGPVEVSVVEREGQPLPASCGKDVEPTPILEATVQGVASA